jgi:hypothetical protein
MKRVERVLLVFFLVGVRPRGEGREKERVECSYKMELEDFDDCKYPRYGLQYWKYGVSKIWLEKI